MYLHLNAPFYAHVALAMCDTGIFAPHTCTCRAAAQAQAKQKHQAQQQLQQQQQQLQQVQT